MSSLTQLPSKEVLVWSEEFLGAAGSTPNSQFWSVDTGDGSDRGLPGWGIHR